MLCADGMAKWSVEFYFQYCSHAFSRGRISLDHTARPDRIDRMLVRRHVYCTHDPDMTSDPTKLSCRPDQIVLCVAAYIGKHLNIYTIIKDELK